MAAWRTLAEIHDQIAVRILVAGVERLERGKLAGHQHDNHGGYPPAKLSNHGRAPSLPECPTLEIRHCGRYPFAPNLAYMRLSMHALEGVVVPRAVRGSALAALPSTKKKAFWAVALFASLQGAGM